MKDRKDDSDKDRLSSKTRRYLLEQAKRVAQQSKGVARDGLDSSGELLTKAGSKTSRVARKTVQQAGTIAEASLGLAAAGFGTVSDRAQTAAMAALAMARDSKDALKDKVFRESVVPVLLLPTGSKQSDFFVAYSFNDALDTLHSGVFVRPVLEIWSARPDVDRSRLVDSLHDTFLEDFKQQKEAVKMRHGRANMQTLVAAREAKADQEASGKDIQSAAGWVGVGLVGMFLTWNPLFDLLFLTLAVYKGAAGIKKVLEFLGHAAREVNMESQIDKSRKELSKLQADLDTRNDSFRQAVKNLEIKVHPKLQELLVDFASIDEQRYVPVEAYPEGPDLREAYRLVAYRRTLPDWGRIILQAHEPIG